MKIAVFHGGIRFVQPLIDDWTSKGHQVRASPNYNEWKDFVPDLIFFEFCTNNIVAFTNKFIYNLDKKPKVVCRLHGVGVRYKIYKNVNWTHVDEVIFISERLKKQCNPYLQDAKVILNGIDLEEFTFKKSFKPTYKIGYVGRWIPSKGIERLPDIMKIFERMDSRYVLVKAIGDIKNINLWLEQIDYLIHPSLIESFCYAVAEAMAKGIRPLINDWDGAAETFGEEFLIRNWNLKQDPIRIRKIIEDRYDQKIMIEKINKVCRL